MASRLLFLNTDSQVLDLIKTGDEEALVLLYQTNRRMITTYIMRNNGTEEDADDLLQEAVVLLWERVRAGRFELTAKLSTFIYATVQNMWRRRLVRMKREMPTDFSGAEETADPSSFLDELVENETSARIAAALAKLGEPCKTLLLLFYWEECSMEEIARRLHFANADTVKSKKYQCKNSLEKILIDERIF